MSSASRAWLELEADTIQILTRAAHKTSRASDGHNFLTFLSRVLTSTVANVGGPQALHAGPGDTSAASHLHALLRGTDENDLDPWLPHRTQPVLITLNVAEIVEGGHPELLDLAAAIDKIVNQALREGAAETAAEQAIEVITARYRDEYRSYAERFTLAAQATGIRHGLRAGVHVATDTDPSSHWRSQTALSNPREGSGDHAAYALWKLAYEAVPLPHVALTDLAPTPCAANKTADHGNGSPTNRVAPLAPKFEVEL